MTVVGERFLPAFVRQREHERQRGVVERERRRARHATRHVGHAVMRHAVDDIYGIGVRRRSRGFEAAALIDCDVDDDRARLHPRDQFARDELRRRSAGNEHAADDEIGTGHVLFHCVPGRVDRVERPPELPPQRAQHVDAAV